MTIDFEADNHEPTIVDIKTRQMELQVLLTDYAAKNAEYKTALQNRTPAGATTINTIKTALDAKKLAIIRKLDVISGLIQNVYPKGIENQSTITSNNPILVTHLNNLNTIYTEVEEIVHEQDKMEGNLEDRSLTYTSNFYNYLMYFVIMIITFVSLFYIYSSPEAGRLETVILLLGLAAGGYYTYVYGVDKIKNFINKNDK